MNGNLRSVLLALAAATTLGAFLFAHDDDGKVLDRQRPYQGPGYHSPLGINGEPLPSFIPSPSGGSYSAAPFSSFNVKLLSWLPLNTWGAAQQNGNSGWGYVSPAGREYALMGLYGGTAFVEITTPGQAVTAGYIAGPNSLWRDVRVYKHPTLGDYAYAVSEGGSGIQVMSLANIDGVGPNRVTLVNTITTGPTPTATHSMEINQQTGYLYRSGGGSNGLRIYDLNATPAAPAYVSSWTTRYVHEVTLVNYTSGPLAGKEIAFACSGGSTNTGIDVLDVTNKLAITSVPNMTRLTWAGGSYSHQCTLSADKHYLYVNDEVYINNHPGTPTINFVFDIQNLGTTQPPFIGSFTNNNPAIPHNEYVDGSLLFQAAYRSGLRVYDLAQNATNPPEIAWFDTYNGSDAPNFNGLWNVHPFYPSGIVTGSDIESGLFVWWVGAPLLSIAFPNGQPATIPNTGYSLRVQITQAQPNVLASGTERLWYRPAGGSWASTPLVALGGGLYDANFPGAACNAVIEYYVSASSTNNIVWSSPEDAPISFHSATAAICTTPPVTYCTPKVNSLGCTPFIDYNGISPSATAASGFTLVGSNVRNNKPGVLLYSLTGRDAQPFGGGVLCVAPTVKRTGGINSGGSPSGNDCTGDYNIDLNAFIHSGAGDPGLQVPGNTVRVQFWGRDQGFAAPNNVTLTDALEAQIAP